MARDPSPIDPRSHEEHSSAAHDRFEDIDSREDHRDRSASSRRTPTQERGDQPLDLGPAVPLTRGRATLYERGHGYRLTLSQLDVVRDLARFRVVPVSDLAEFIYGKSEENARPELHNLIRQGLVLTTTFERPETTPRELATLTKRGNRLISENALVAEQQATYSGFVKPKEANHDADLYRMYQKEIARIIAEGGEPVRVVLDYELKKKINRDIARYGESAKPEIATRHGLSYVRGQIPIPDLQIEYATRDGELARISLELVTEHYRGSSMGQKIRAGFKLYARHGETDRLRRGSDQQGLTAEIFSL